MLGGQVLIERDPCIIKLANAWMILNVGGGPTEDKPDVIPAPPVDLKKASSFMNIRVADIKCKYDEWRSKGAEFVTSPIDRGGEIRCYMRDPDGYLIEVGEATGILKMFGGGRAASSHESGGRYDLKNYQAYVSPRPDVT